MAGPRAAHRRVPEPDHSVVRAPRVGAGQDRFVVIGAVLIAALPLAVGAAPRRWSSDAGGQLARVTDQEAALRNRCDGRPSHQRAATRTRSGMSGSRRNSGSRWCCLLIPIAYTRRSSTLLS